MGLMKDIDHLFHVSKWVTLTQSNEIVNSQNSSDSDVYFGSGSDSNSDYELNRDLRGGISRDSDVSRQASSSRASGDSLNDDSRATSAEASQADNSAQASSSQSHDAAEPPVPSTFSLLYESRDNRLCLFETRDGHLTAVNVARLI